jgi:hypothetical protein
VQAHPAIGIHPRRAVGAVTAAGASVAPAPASTRDAPERATQLSGWLTPRMWHLLFLGTLLAVLRSGGLFLSADGDPGRHLAVGRHILETRSIPSVDVFSHTMGGEPFVPYEWLAETLSALAFQAAGLAGPALLHGAVIGLSLVLVYAQLRARGLPLLLALGVTVLVGATSAVHWLARPHVFTFLGTALFSYVLDGWFAGRLSRRTLWLLAPAMALWVNLHGGFLIGLILLGAYAGCDALRAIAGDAETAAPARGRLRRLIPVAAGAAVATLLNPAGPGLFAHVTGYFGKKMLVNQTGEYMSPDFHQADVAVFLASLLLLLVALAFTTRRPALHEVGLCAAFTYFGLYSARNIPLWAIVVAPALATALAGIAPPRVNASVDRLLDEARAWLGARNAAYTRMDGRARGHLWPAVALGALLGVCIVQARAGEAPLGIGIDPARQPVGALTYVKAHLPEGNVFNELVWGGYVLHELWPRTRVFIDGQTDFYGEALTAEYLAIRAAEPGWSEALDRRHIKWVLLPLEAPLARALRGTGSWRAVYVDSVAVVLVRETPITLDASVALDIPSDVRTAAR